MCKEDPCEECESWRTVAAQSNRDIDAWLRQIYPFLPEHYGMPLDGIRRALLPYIAVAKAAQEYQQVLKSLKPWEMSPLARGIIGEYDDELPSIIEVTSRDLYMAVEELNFQLAQGLPETARASVGPAASQPSHQRP